MQLDGKKIAILIAPRGTEDPEFAKPKQAIEAAGGTVTVISLEAGKAETVNNDLDAGSSYTVDKAIADVSAAHFDALVVPGGWRRRRQTAQRREGGRLHPRLLHRFQARRRNLPRALDVG